jgi:hypothetical protein
MEHNTKTFTAALLYRDPRDILLLAAVPQITDLANRYGVASGAVRKCGAGKIVFETDEVSLTLEVSDAAIGFAKILRAGRPAAEVFGRTEINRRVKSHGAAITLTAVALNSVSASSRAVQMLNDMALLLVGRTMVSAVHWTPTDKVYAGEEFRSSTCGHTPVRPSRPTRAYLATSRRQSRRPDLPLVAAETPAVIELRPYQEEAERIAAIRDAAECPGPNHGRTGGFGRAASAAAVAALAKPVALAGVMQSLSAAVKFG